MVEGEEQPLVPGMCFSVEPGIYLPGGSASGSRTSSRSPTTAAGGSTTPSGTSASSSSRADSVPDGLDRTSDHPMGVRLDRRGHTEARVRARQLDSRVEFWRRRCRICSSYRARP